MIVAYLTGPMIALTGWSWGLYGVGRQETDKEVDMPRSHRKRSASRPDPSGGGQKVFWLLLLLAAIAAIGIVVLYQQVTP